MNFREIFERLVKLWAGKFRLSLRILKTHSITLPEKVRGLEGTWGLLVLEVGIRILLVVVEVELSRLAPWPMGPSSRRKSFQNSSYFTVHSTVSNNLLNIKSQALD